MAKGHAVERAALFRVDMPGANRMATTPGRDRYPAVGVGFHDLFGARGIEDHYFAIGVGLAIENQQQFEFVADEARQDIELKLGVGQ